MKSSILVCQLEAGMLHSVAFPHFSEADEALAKIRKERLIEITKKAVPVLMAVLITQNAGSAQVVKTANIKAEALREAAVQKGAKAKADADAKAKAEKTKELKK